MLSYIASLKPEWVTGDTILKNLNKASPTEALGAGFLCLELSRIILSVPREGYRDGRAPQRCWTGHAVAFAVVCGLRAGGTQRAGRSQLFPISLLTSLTSGSSC